MAVANRRSFLESVGCGMLAAGLGSTLAQELRLPLTTVARAIAEFCGKLRRQAQMLGINQQG